MSIPFACDMSAIPAERRGAHHALIRRLMTEAVEEISELPDGLAFRFPAEDCPTGDRSASGSPEPRG
jgi:hypothetical protein